MKNFIHYYILIVVLILGTTSCVSLSGFEEGRSLKEEQSSIQVNFNTMQVSDVTSSDIIDLSFFPNLEVGYKYGFSGKFDLGVKANTFGNMGVNAKYQILGDQRSDFAMALGTEFNSFLGLGLFNAHVPLYMSYYPSEKWTFNIAPRYVVQFGSGFGDDLIRAINYLGGNAGVMFGSKHKVGLDIGYHQLFGPENITTGMLNIGIGAKFLIGGNGEAMVPIEPKNNRRRK
jgi:hypothetical protein